MDGFELDGCLGSQRVSVSGIGRSPLVRVRAVAESGLWNTQMSSRPAPRGWFEPVAPRLLGYVDDVDRSGVARIRDVAVVRTGESRGESGPWMSGAATCRCTGRRCWSEAGREGSG